MVADRQVHALPERPAELERFATFMGFPAAAAFADALLDRLARVRARYAEVFEQVPELLEGQAAAAPTLDFRGDGRAGGDAGGAARPGLRRAGPHRRRGARLAGRARARVALGAGARADGPDAAGAAGGARPAAAAGRDLRPVRRVHRAVSPPACSFCRCSSATRLARAGGGGAGRRAVAGRLSGQHPAALEGLLSPQEDDPPARLLRSRLHDARLLEDVIGIIRRTVREADFSLSVATMEGRLDADAPGERRSALADAALAALLPPVLADFATRFGPVRGGAMAVVVLGKAGGREMMAGSDLDLMLVYAHPEDVTESRGARVVAGEPVVRPRGAQLCRGGDRARGGRAALRGGHAAAAVGQQGAGRGVAGQLPPLPRGGRLDLGAHGADPRARGRRAAGVARAGGGGDRRGDGRGRRPGADPRRRRGDAGAHAARPAAGRAVGREAAARAARWRSSSSRRCCSLHAAREAPAVCSPNTCEALRRLAAAGQLDAHDAALLVRADRVWRTVQGMLRITVGRDAAGALPEMSLRPLLRAVAAAGVPTADLPGLRAVLDDVARDVSRVFARIVGDSDAEDRGTAGRPRARVTRGGV